MINAQLTLRGITLGPVTYADDATPFARFQAFHQANPHVLDALIDICLDVQARGRRRWSTKGAFEVLRWASIRTDSDDFKLNNNYTAPYARLIAMVEPRLASFFAMRESDAASAADLNAMAADARLLRESRVAA